MLACYPLIATAENWLHETLVSMIQTLHIAVEGGKPIVESQIRWKALLPKQLSDPILKDLASSTGLRDRFFKYGNSIVSLSTQDRARILDILVDQNRIPELLNGTCAIPVIENNLLGVRDAAYELFVFAFGKLTDFEVRKRQYQIIFNSLGNKICPFCGIDRVMNPAETAQDQDHYLAKSLYPFGATNMRNLVPMCSCCNRDYKKAQDVINDQYGMRRVAIDPYDCIPIQITLTGSDIDDIASPPIPDWNVNFIPATQQAETWDAVFNIRTRFKRDILNNYYGTWIEGFRSKCVMDRKKGKILPNLSAVEIREVLADFKEYKEMSPSIGMAGFLEPLVFELLLEKYDAGDVRVLDLIRDTVLGTDLETAG
ncbi:MAG: hypothetical protein WA191_14405 [Telluria sp.]